MSQIDLRAYFARIGYTGPTTPTLETLRAIHRLHPQAIPFENLDPLRGAAVHLELPRIEEKLVHGRRGGYCFEHNLILREVLLALGFRVRGLAARVVWNAPPGAVPPRGHMLLRVGTETEDLIADVGFGGQVLTGPLRLDLRLEQPTPHEPFRLVEEAGQYTLEARLPRAPGEPAAAPAGAAADARALDWRPLYRFDLTEQHPVDYVAVNYYLSTSPASHFTTGLIAARTEPDRRFALRNAQLAIHPMGGETERRTLGSARELRAALEETFGIAVPADPKLDAAFTRLASPPA
jgi:N-hydroxyarylamine O-acetyltransferase